MEEQIQLAQRTKGEMNRNTEGQPFAPISYLKPSQLELTDAEDSTRWLEYWQLFQRRKGTILLIAFLGALAGFLFTLPQTPIYRVRTSLEIQGLNENFMNMREVDPMVGNYSADSYIQTQLRILQSESLIERVVEKLKLEERPAFAYQPDRISAWRRALSLPQPGPISRESAVAMASRNLKVSSSVGTRIVEIFYLSPDPQLATNFANALANEFIEQNVQARWQSTQKTGEWLTRQLEDLQIKLEKSEDALQAYTSTAGLVFTSEKDNVAEEKLRQLQEELSKAQAERISKQSQCQLAESSSAESVPKVLDDPSLRGYQANLTDLRRQLAELRTTFTPSHYKVKYVESQIAVLQSTLAIERGNIIKRMRNEYMAAQLREKMLAAAYANQSRLVSEQRANAVHYNILKREVDTNRNLYETVLQKVKEAGIASAMRASNIRVVDPAKTPSAPYAPNVFVNSALGLLTGIFLGVGFVIFRERADRSIQQPGDTFFYLNLPELGVIPSAKAELKKRLEYKPRLLSALGWSKNGADDQTAPDDQGSEPNDQSTNTVELATWRKGSSLLAESFRTTLTSILFSAQKDKLPRVIMITSPCSAEGKSTIASNLGIALAEIKYRTLLIDGDMRKPSLHRIFDLPNKWGLSDLLRWSKPLDQWPMESLSRQTKIPGLNLLPSGQTVTNASGLLHSGRFPELLNCLRQQFDFVLIDTPPMLHLSDARVMGRLADGAILVIRSGQTTRDSAVAACQRLADDGILVAGTILNDWDPTTADRKYSYYNGYYQYYSYGKTSSG